MSLNDSLNAGKDTAFLRNSQIIREEKLGLPSEWESTDGFLFKSGQERAWSSSSQRMAKQEVLSECFRAG